MAILPQEAVGDLSEPLHNEQPSVLQKLQKWGDYDAFGDAVSPTKFIPMKTPLGSEILENWNLEDPPRHPLTVAILQKQQSCLGRQVGMIIDLSNHDSLYGPDLIECGIQYERVPLVAKIFPAQQAVNQVVEKADRFWGESPHLYIGIHCAYGFNRTGFVLSSYLIQACNYSVQEAVDSFALARPPGIRHEQFIAELHKRYDGWNPGHPRALRPSFSDLRGYASYNGRQRVESLQSDFMGVAEHLYDNHPSIATRLSGVSGGDPNGSVIDPSEEVLGSLPPLEASDRPSIKTRNALASSSTNSLDPSRCESLNNESLDLDEREIFKQFSSRQHLPGDELVRGHHRRPGLTKFLPAIRAESSSPTASLSPSQSTPSQKSPFASRQSQDGFHYQPALRQSPDGSSPPQSEDLANGLAAGRNDSAVAGSTGDRSGIQQIAARLQPGNPPPEPGGRPVKTATLLKNPITARVITNSGLNRQDCSTDEEREGWNSQETRRRCTIM